MSYPGRLQDLLIGNTPATLRLRIADVLPTEPYSLAGFHEATWPGYTPGHWMVTASDLTPNGWATITGQALVGCTQTLPAALAKAAYLVAEGIDEPALLGVLLLLGAELQLVKAPGVWYVVTWMIYQDTPGFE